jgi:hypothetical protein
MATLTEQPTHTRACTEPGCGRVVGPYHSPAAASAAMAEHVHIRHLAVQSGTPYPREGHH